MKFKTVVSIALSFLILTSVLFAAPQEVAKADEKPVKCPKKVGVLVQEIKPAKFDEFKRIKSSVIPGKLEDVATPQNGAVKSVEKALGSEVILGDVVVILDDASIKHEIDNANAEIKRWKRNLWKRENWKVRSQRAEAQAKRMIEKNQELLAEKEAQLKQCSITAPISGVVSELKVKEGDHVSKDFVLLTISNMEKVLVPVMRFGDKIAEGQAFKVRIKELSKVFKGLGVKADKTYLVIDNPMMEIKKGMTAVFKLLYETHENVVVLAKARILKDDGGKFVYIASGNTAFKTKLKTGPVEKGRVLIKDGLKAGEEMIVAEVLKAKTGTLRDEITCLQDGKKIKIMVMDEVKGRYVKRKKGAKSPPVPVMARTKEPEKVKPEVKPEAKPEVKPVKKKPVEEKPKKVKKPKKKKVKPLPGEHKVKFRIGAHLGYAKISNQDFEDVYGRMMSFGIDLSYFITDNIDIWASIATGKKTGEVPDFPEVGLEFSYVPLSIDVRYFFKRSPKFDIFAGLGLSYYRFEENITDIDLESVSDTAIGFNMLGGAYYHITRSFSAQLMLRWSAVKKTITEPVVDNEVNLGGIELLFGFTFGF